MCQHTGYNPHCMALIPSLRFLKAPPLYLSLINKPIWWLPCSRHISVGSAPTCRLPPNANREPELVVAVWSFPSDFFFFHSHSSYWLFRCKYGGRRCLWIDCPLYLFASGLAACLCYTQRSSLHHLAQHSDHCLVSSEYRRSYTLQWLAAVLDLLIIPVLKDATDPCLRHLCNHGLFNDWWIVGMWKEVVAGQEQSSKIGPSFGTLKSQNRGYSADGIASRLRVGRSGVRVLVWAKRFVFCTASRRALGATQPRIQWVPGFFPGVGT